jgi:hypothetical protein
MKGKKVLVWVTVLFMLSSVCFIASAQETPEKNLIINGSFEDAVSNWYTNPTAHPERVSPDDSTSTDSERSLKLDGTTPDKPFWMGTSGGLGGKLKPAQDYILKADIRRTVNKGTIGIAIVEKPEEKTWNESISHWCGTNSEKGLNTWEHFELKFKTNPKVDAAAIYLYNMTAAESPGLTIFN